MQAAERCGVHSNILVSWTIWGRLGKWYNELMGTIYGTPNVLSSVWKSSLSQLSYCPVSTPIAVILSAGLCSSCHCCSPSSDVCAGLSNLYSHRSPSHCPSVAEAGCALDAHCCNKHLWTAGFPSHLSFLWCTPGQLALPCIYKTLAVLQVLPLLHCQIFTIMFLNTEHFLYLY